ncbi:MAG: protein phosphatase 2C domain-containing protein [Desulfocapsaceae bacterium]|nr:protein phosphatase 2C domain-containing protein [Desulfocapsaceae bacterium]
MRKFNEDRLHVEQFDNGTVLVAVADWMGGEKGGAMAAELAVQSLNSFDPELKEIEKLLTRLIRSAHQSVIAMAEQKAELKRMGTTLTAAFLNGTKITWAHTGDSRAYLLREGHLIQITDDHSVTGFLLREGEISVEEAKDHPLRNVLLRCLGCEPLQVDNGEFEAAVGDIFLLTTDGLHDYVSEDEMVSILTSGSPLEAKLDSLTRSALAVGGRDNITIVAVEI